MAIEMIKEKYLSQVPYLGNLQKVKGETALRLMYHCKMGMHDAFNEIEKWEKDHAKDQQS